MNVGCLVCGEHSFVTLFKGRVVEQHVLRRCVKCGMVQAFRAEGFIQPQKHDYSSYGDYLLVDHDADVRRRVDSAAQAMRPWFELVPRESSPPAVLDFGSGAGYLGKAAEEFGFDAFGIEISSKLVEFSKKRVGFLQVYPALDALRRQFDAIFMADVIEHLEPTQSRALMAQLVDRLKPGGLLIGNTPNIRSANILIFKERDPVIAPPSHVCYFSPATLDSYLKSLGLVRKTLFSAGLSQDSFIRKSKFEPSFLEKPWRTAPMRLLAFRIPLKLAFRAAGLPLRPLGLGYQIYFAYRKGA